MVKEKVKAEGVRVAVILAKDVDSGKKTTTIETFSCSYNGHVHKINNHLVNNFNNNISKVEVSLLQVFFLHRSPLLRIVDPDHSIPMAVRFV